MSEKIKFVLESFEDFLRVYPSLNEAETKSSTIMDVNASKNLIDKMFDYNIDLGVNALERQAKKLKDSKLKELKKYTAETLKKKEFWKAAACSLFSRSNEEGNLNKNLGILKQLGLDFDTLKKQNFNQRVSSFLEAIKPKEDGDIKESVIDDINRNPELLGTQLRYSVLWQMVPDEDRTKVYDDFERLARSKGFRSSEGIETVITKHYENQKKNEKIYLTNPGIVVGLTKDQLEKSTPPLKTREVTCQVVPVSKQHETFKPNKWGLDGSSDYVGDNFEEIKNNIGKILEERKIGRVTKIKSITVQTSCDRRRNTEKAVNMSWGQLALARAFTLAQLVIDMAKAVELQPEEIEVMKKMIRLDFLGSNGDGSSGPNPDVNPGFYVKKGESSQWVTSKNPSEIVIIPASKENGEPTETSGENAKTEKEPPISAKEPGGFDVYRYSNIIFEVDVIEPEEGAGKTIPTVEMIKGIKYPIQLRLPSRYKPKSLEIRIPSFTLGKVSGSPGKRPSIQCPDLTGKGKTSLGLGFEWKPVTLARWKSDITEE